MEALGSKETLVESMRSSEATARGSSKNHFPRRAALRPLTKRADPLGAALLSSLCFCFFHPRVAPATSCSHRLGLQLGSLLLISTGRSELCLKEKPPSNGSSRDTSRTSEYQVLPQSKGAGVPTGLSPTWARPGLPKQWRPRG